MDKKGCTVMKIPKVQKVIRHKIDIKDEFDIQNEFDMTNDIDILARCPSLKEIKGDCDMYLKVDEKGNLISLELLEHI